MAINTLLAIQFISSFQPLLSATKETIHQNRPKQENPFEKFNKILKFPSNTTPILNHQIKHNNIKSKREYSILL
jgi:hypothetical protein